MLTPHEEYIALGRIDAERQAAYRALFRPELDDEAISDIRRALDQSQPLGDSRFLDRIEQATGQRREARPRGRPRKIGGGGRRSARPIAVNNLSLAPFIRSKGLSPVTVDGGIPAWVLPTDSLKGLVPKVMDHSALPPLGF